MTPGTETAETGAGLPLVSDESSRGVSFVDAIYGFAAALLVGNVVVRDPEAWNSLAQLAKSGLYTQLFAFVVSFTVIAVFWRDNVRLTRRLTRLDGVTTSISLAVVGLVILIPFSTQGISDPVSTNLTLPNVVYALNIALVDLGQSVILFEIARARGLERHRMQPRAHLAHVLVALITPVVFFASIPITFVWGPTAGKFTWASLLVIYPVVRGVLHRTVAQDRG